MTAYAIGSDATLGRSPESLSVEDNPQAGVRWSVVRGATGRLPGETGQPVAVAV